MILKKDVLPCKVWYIIWDVKYANKYRNLKSVYVLENSLFSIKK
jgi:hypothetical protein